MSVAGTSTPSEVVPPHHAGLEIVKERFQVRYTRRDYAQALCDLRANNLRPQVVCDIVRADCAVEVCKLSDDSYDDRKARGKAAGNHHLPMHTHLYTTDNDPR